MTLPQVLQIVAALATAPPERAPTFDPQALDGLSNPGSDLHLEPRRDGTYVYRDADSRFRAIIHADGSVEYLPAPPDLHLTFLGFDLLGRGRRSEPPPTPSLPAPPPMAGTADPTHDPGSYGAVPILIGFGGPMPGALDMVQRERDFAAKARFLDDTADLRRALADQSRARHTRERLRNLPTELAAIWNDPAHSPATRRAMLFARWDECAEDTPAATSDENEAERAQAGERARRLIEAFVRVHLPEGDPRGYTRAELERMNARRLSRQRFDPYRGAPPAEDATPAARH